MFRILLSFLFLFQQVAHAEGPIRYSEKIESYKHNGGKLHMMRRSSRVQTEAGSYSVNDLQIAKPNGDVLQTTSFGASFRFDGYYGSVVQALDGKHFSQAQFILNSGFYFSREASGLGIPMMFNVLPPTMAPGFSGDGSLNDFYYQSGEMAKQWMALNELQKQAQNDTVVDLNNGLAQLRVKNSENFASSFSSLFQGGEKLFDLSSKTDFLEQLTEVKNQIPKVESVIHSPAFQKELISDIPSLFQEDKDLAAETISDMVTPLNQSTLKETKAALSAMGIQNGVMPGTQVNHTGLGFANPDLEDKRIRVQNRLQSIGHQFPRFMKSRGGIATRSAALWLHAAQNAEANGDLGLAQTYMERAASITHAGPGDPSWEPSEYSEALRAYAGDDLPNMGLQTINSEFSAVANSVGGYLADQLKNGELIEEKEAAAKAGLYFVKKADESSVNGDSELQNAYLDVAIGAVDIITGFVPAVSLVKDSYEAVTGKHWITGDELSDFDRAVALGGVLTLGFGSQALKGIKLAKKAFKHVSSTVLKNGQRISSAMTKIGVRSKETYQRVRGSLGGVSNIDQAESIILNTAQEIPERMRDVGFKVRYRGLHTAEQLNKKMIDSGGYQYAKPNTWAHSIEVNDPRTLVRLSLEGKEARVWFVHEDVFNALAKKSSSAEELALRLKQELNLGYVPTNASRLKAKPEGYQAIVSEIKRVPEVNGVGEGQLQFEFLEIHKGDIDWERSGTIEKFFNEGGL